MNKRAAIELSMNVIIVIVIGVVVLSMGLFFVRSIFEKIAPMTDDMLDQARKDLQNIEPDTLITLTTNQKELTSRSTRVVGVIIYNTEAEILEYKLKAESKDPKIKCYFSSSGNTETPMKTLNSLAKFNDFIVIEENGGGVRNAICNIRVIGASEGLDNEESLILSIKP
ncbi:hypothetical protein J4468_02190 [Candidatus Woesearchaeota archaeon]|nr:hypothetical protein [Candidatus Woesearchaeota archaeon]